MEALEMDRRLQAALGEQSRDDLLLEHALELAWHAGREIEACLADVQREAASGADGIVDDFGGRGQHGLLAVVRRHHPAAPTEEGFHRRQPSLVEHERHARGLGGDLLREIVDGWAEAAVDDDGAGAGAGQAEGLQQALAIVADGRLPRDRQPDVLELLADVSEVGVDDLAGEHLVAGADHLDAHQRTTFSSASTTACGFSRGMKWPTPGTTRSSVPGGNSAMSRPTPRARLTASSPPCRMIVGTVIGGR